MRTTAVAAPRASRRSAFSRVCLCLLSCFGLSFALCSGPACAQDAPGYSYDPAQVAGQRESLQQPSEEDREPFFGLFSEAEATPQLRYDPSGNGHIPITDPADDPYLPIFESDDPDSIFARGRPNMLNQHVEDQWDFYNLINTDRPDFTDSPYSAGRGVTIIENGYTFRRVNDDSSSATRQNLPETLFRYGLTDEFELRFKWNGLVKQDLHDYSTGVRGQLTGGDDPLVAFKYEVLQQKGWRPLTTVLAGTTIPAGTGGLSANQTQPFVNLVLGYGIRRWLYFKYSFGSDWTKSPSLGFSTVGGTSISQIVVGTTGRNNFTELHNSVSLLFQVSQRFGGFAEWFTFNSLGDDDNTAVNYFDCGAFIYATTNVQFDVRLGKRLSNRVDEVFTGGGLSIRY